MTSKTHSSGQESVPYLDLKKINERIRCEIEAVLAQMLDAGRYIGGQVNSGFCENFAAFCGVKAAVGVGNGLDALRLILQTADIGPGDEVIVPANTFIATILAISQAGATPVLVEPDPETFNLDYTRIEEAITPKTRAIMPVHLYGRIAPMAEINEIAKRHGLLVFEDAAQAHGAICQGKRAGSLGDAAGFSFYPGKNLGCLGDGGAITANDAEFVKKAAIIANYGSEKKYEHLHKGCNSRLDDFQAGVLNLKLASLDADNERRRGIAAFYDRNISNPAVRKPAIPQNPLEHVWHIYALRVQKREDFRRHMASRGVETLIHYPTPPHKQGAFTEYSEKSLPITEAIHREVVSIPLNQVMTDEQANRVVEAINAWQ